MHACMCGGKTHIYACTQTHTPSLYLFLTLSLSLSLLFCLCLSLSLGLLSVCLCLFFSLIYLSCFFHLTLSCLTTLFHNVSPQRCGLCVHLGMSVTDNLLDVLYWCYDDDDDDRWSAGCVMGSRCWQPASCAPTTWWRPSSSRRSMSSSWWPLRSVQFTLVVDGRLSVCVYLCMCVCARARVCACVCVYACVCVHAHIANTHTHLHVHACAHADTYTNMHVQTWRPRVANIHTCKYVCKYIYYNLRGRRLQKTHYRVG